IFAYELARERLSKRHLARATMQAELYDPEGAVDAGFLDRTCEAGALAETALAEARRLAAPPHPAPPPPTPPPPRPPPPRLPCSPRGGHGEAARAHAPGRRSLAPAR